MKALTGDVRGKRVEILKRYSIGRIFCGHSFKPYEGELWGFDNGAFKDYLKGSSFNKDRYLKWLERALKMAQIQRPYLAVLPDIVGGGERSLELSLTYLHGELKGVNLPWYLAVQDGMELQTVEKILKENPQIVGLFLGGTDIFKATAPRWSSLAHSLGLKFHYARAGSVKKIRLARAAKADSIDSALPLWSEDKFKRFLKAVNQTPISELPLFQ